MFLTIGPGSGQIILKSHTATGMITSQTTTGLITVWKSCKQVQIINGMMQVAITVSVLSAIKVSNVTEHLNRFNVQL